MNGSKECYKIILQCCCLNTVCNTEHCPILRRSQDFKKPCHEVVKSMDIEDAVNMLVEHVNKKGVGTLFHELHYFNRMENMNFDAILKEGFSRIITLK